MEDEPTIYPARRWGQTNRPMEHQDGSFAEGCGYALKFTAVAALFLFLLVIPVVRFVFARWVFG